MKINELKKLIRNILKEQTSSVDKSEKEKNKLQKQKIDVDKEKTDFNKEKLNFDKRQSNVKQASGGGGGGMSLPKEPQSPEGKGEEEKPKPNISFKTQGQYYSTTFPRLKSLMLSDGDMANEDERHFIALAIESAKGRFDGDFEKYLTKGYARNIYGKDFSDKDIKLIIDFCKKNELVR